MILMKLFHGDSVFVAEIQRNVYQSSVQRIFEKCRAKYRGAEELLGVHTELGDALFKIHLDHRPLQWLHDILAGEFRRRCCVEGSLFDVGERVLNEEKSLSGRWRDFLDIELDRLFIGFPQLPRFVGLAVCFPNPDPRGIGAEEWLYELTLAEYDGLVPSTTGSL
jgi:hypothetical protein